MAARLREAALVRDAFDPWLGMIANATIRELTIEFLRRAHPRFYAAPSSSKGTAHPPDEFFSGPDGDLTNAPPKGRRWGGQVYHVARVCYTALLLAECWDLSPLDRELVVAGALVHDIGKYVDGQTQTDHHHDTTVAALTADLADIPRFRHFYPQFIAICEAHAGRYGARMPSTPVERAVSTADFLASRPGFGGFDPYPKEPDYR